MKATYNQTNKNIKCTRKKTQISKTEKNNGYYPNYRKGKITSRL